MNRRAIVASINVGLANCAVATIVALRWATTTTLSRYNESADGLIPR